MTTKTFSNTTSKESRWKFSRRPARKVKTGMTQTRPIAIDWFCKAGAASRGLHKAGFDVIGVDIEPQPNYPFPFFQADAMVAMRQLAAGHVIVVGERFVRASDVTLHWASPPCQGFTSLNEGRPRQKDHPDLLTPTLGQFGRNKWNFIVENVESRAVSDIMRGCGYAWQTTRLCGSQFKLGFQTTAFTGGLGAARADETRRYDMRRHRLFATSFPVDSMPCTHDKQNAVVGIYGGHVRCRSKKFGGRGTVDFEGYDKDELASLALGLPKGSMTMDEYSNAIPPAYAQYLAEQFLKAQQASR